MNIQGTAESAKVDQSYIYDLIPTEVKVLDLGCGDGSLLEKLRKKKKCLIQGIDIDQEQIMQCISKGVPVIQNDLDSGLIHFENNSFDYVILGQTFQQVKHPDQLLHEMLRVGNKAIISIINMGFWKSRFQLSFGGTMPKTKSLPYAWYNTPNIHLGTVKDFKELCQSENFQFTLQHADGSFGAKLFPNLMAELCTFELSLK